MTFQSVVNIFPSDEIDWALKQRDTDDTKEEEPELDASEDEHNKKFKSSRLSDCNLLLRYIQLAKDKDRSGRLREMIKTTGRQLYAAYLKNAEYFQ